MKKTKEFPMSGQTNIVISDGFNATLFDELKKVPEFNVADKAKMSQEELKELLPTVEGLVVRSATKPNKELIDAAPSLKYIIRAGEGTDNIDKAYCQEKGIKVSNTPGANNNSAAEHAIALMMTVLRKTAWAHQSMQSGKWDKAAYMGNELTNKTVGIVGFGRIGQLVAKRLAGFDPKVLFFDPGNTNSPFDYAQKCDDLEKLFSESDIVTVHVPLLDQTRNMIDLNLLSKMKKDAILINAARGKIVDEAALAEALKNGSIRGAGFDVFATEPLEENSELRNLENLVLTPHLGGSTEEAQYRVGEMAVHQLKEFFINNNLLNEVKA